MNRNGLKNSYYIKNNKFRIKVFINKLKTFRFNNKTFLLTPNRTKIKFDIYI